MRLIIMPAAQKDLRGIPAKDAAALLARLKAIAAEPFAAHPFVKKLTTRDGFRARHGDWRALYRIDRQSGDVVVERIRHRSEAYR